MPYLIYARRQGQGTTTPPAYDDTWENVSLLMHMEGTHGSSSFIDEVGYAVTNIGTPTITTAQSKFGSASGQFGSGNFVNVPADSRFDFSSSDFTAEAWIRPTSVPAAWGGIMSHRRHGETEGWFLAVLPNGTLQLFGLINSSWGAYFTTTGTVSLNQWSHVAFVRSGSSYKIYINGVGETVPGISSFPYATAASSFTVGEISYNGTQGPFYGQMDEVRVSKGIARYLTDFAVPTAQFPDSPTPQTGYDEYWPDVVMLSHFNGTHGSTAFTEEKGGTLTGTGGPIISATQKKFGISSGYFDGTNDYISYSNSNLAFGTNDFTIECWVHSTVNTIQGAASRTILGATTDNYQNQLYLNIGTGQVVFGNTGAYYVTSTTSVTDGDWHHVAVTRQGTDLRIFIDGVLENTTYSNASITNTSYLIGSFDGVNGCFNGYIDEVRITKNVARYTSTFTAPTEPFEDWNTMEYFWDNTMLLVPFDGDYADERGHTTALAGSGALSGVKKYGTGGLSVLAGNSSGLTVTADSNLSFGTTDFTMECWFYPTGNAGGNNSYLIGQNPTFAGSWPATTYLYYTSSYGLYGQWSSTGGTDTIGGATMTLNTWHHIALVKQGAVFSLYLDGVRVATKTSTVTTLKTNTDPVRIGYFSDGSTYARGYFDDAKITMAARYSGPRITPPLKTPSVPPTVDPYWNYVSALLHMDGTHGSTTFTDEKGNTVTPTNASVTTSTVKYGTGSADVTGGGADIAITGSSAFEFGTGDFTVEGWFYIPTLGGYKEAASCWNHGIGSYVPGQWELFVDPSGMIFFDVATGASSHVRLQGTAGDVSAATWSHIAIVRVNGTVYGFVNGVQKFTGSITSVCGLNEAQHIGRAFGGYVDDFRITKGVARYTGKFVPPTELLED